MLSPIRSQMIKSSDEQSKMFPKKE